MTYYKFLTKENHGGYSGFNFTPYLPTDKNPGPWLPEVEGELEMCQRGYHACKRDDILEWINAQLWLVEYKDPPEEYDNKVNGRCIRFVRRVEGCNDRTLRLLAVYCARDALSQIDDPHPDVVEACDVAERYANGEATKEELEAASWAAYWAASSAAYWAAYSAASKRHTDKFWEMVGGE